jgi:H+/Cl- antiporter ClcA
VGAVGSLLQVGAAWGGLWGSALRDWLQHWNIQPGVYGIMAASSVLAGVFRYVGLAQTPWSMFERAST